MKKTNENAKRYAAASAEILLFTPEDFLTQSVDPGIDLPFEPFGS